MTPGYKTTEFWLSFVAMLLGVLMTSGAVAQGSMAAQIVGGVLSVLSVLGYTKSRADVKVADIEAPALPAPAAKGPELL